MLIRFLIYLIIFGAIYFGVRRIIVDWRAKFKDLDQQKHERDLKERERPDVVELELDDDGVYRPPSNDDSTRSDKK